jgi:hypothetical protein
MTIYVGKLFIVQAIDSLSGLLFGSSKLTNWFFLLHSIHVSYSHRIRFQTGEPWRPLLIGPRNLYFLPVTQLLVSSAKHQIFNLIFANMQIAGMTESVNRESYASACCLMIVSCDLKFCLISTIVFNILKH